MLAPRLPCSLFVLDGTGSLKLTDCLIEGLKLPPNSVLTAPLISLSTGTATFSELTVTNLNFSDEAAIKSTNTLSLTVSQSSFENITRKAESGLALSAVVQSSPSVSVTLSNFTACHSLDEDFSLETEASDTNYMATGRGATVWLVGASSSSRRCGIGVHASTLDTLSTSSNVFSSLTGKAR